MLIPITTKVLWPNTSLFNCDITYCTNSTLGFAYLNSALASRGIGDVKPIARPLHAAIIDEVDEILVDDARNPHYRTKCG